jgi:predicted nucleic acid-binding protein
LSLVIDASALAAVIFEEPERAAVAGITRGHELHAPPIIELELPNIYLKKLRRRPTDADPIRKRLTLFFAMPIQISAVDPGRALALAERFSLSFYDACYLQLAEERDMPLVTLDKRLAVAVATLGRLP